MADELYQVVIQGWVIKKDYMGHPDSWDWTMKERWDDFVVTPQVRLKKVDDEPILKEVRILGPQGIGTMSFHVEKATYDQLKAQLGDTLLDN